MIYTGEHTGMRERMNIYSGYILDIYVEIQEANLCSFMEFF